MRTFIFQPPVKRAAGGVTVLRQLAAILNRSGFDVTLVLREPTKWTPSGLDDLPEIDWADFDLVEKDLWLVPEGWPNALAPGLNAKAGCLVYCQNWAYLLSSLPQGVRWDHLPVSFAAVSHPVGWFVNEVIGRDAVVIRPSIDPVLFSPPREKPDGKVRIAWMPRKNKALAERIFSIFTARNPDAEVEWAEISGLPAEGVAEILRSAHIFLATGFPEGCPLPPLEAMACGCLCTGFSGFGGWDYMRQAAGTNFRPWWPLRDVPWGGNGLFCADADVLDAALNLERAVAWWRNGDERLEGVLDAARATAKSYSPEAQESSVLGLWRTLSR